MFNLHRPYMLVIFLIAGLAAGLLTVLQCWLKTPYKIYNNHSSVVVVPEAMHLTLDKSPYKFHPH